MPGASNSGIVSASVHEDLYTMLKYFSTAISREHYTISPCLADRSLIITTMRATSRLGGGQLNYLHVFWMVKGNLTTQNKTMQNKQYIHLLLVKYGQIRAGRAGKLCRRY